jgi:hypothetical protein
VSKNGEEKGGEESSEEGREEKEIAEPSGVPGLISGNVRFQFEMAVSVPSGLREPPFLLSSAGSRGNP